LTYQLLTAAVRKRRNGGSGVLRFGGDFSMDSVATALDLAWPTVVVLALIFLVALETHRRQRKGKLVRGLAVLLCATLLFPSLSTLDDLIGLALLSAHFNHEDTSGILPPSDSQTGPGFELGIQLLAFDHLSVTPFYHVTPALQFALSVDRATRASIGHTPRDQAGRDPPLV